SFSGVVEQGFPFRYMPAPERILQSICKLWSQHRSQLPRAAIQIGRRAPATAALGQGSDWTAALPTTLRSHSDQSHMVKIIPRTSRFRPLVRNGRVRLVCHGGVGSTRNGGLAGNKAGSAEGEARDGKAEVDGKQLGFPAMAGNHPQLHGRRRGASTRNGADRVFAGAGRRGQVLGTAQG